MKKSISYLLLTVTLGVMPMVWTGCAVTSGRETAGQYTDDKAITAKVKSALVRDPNVKASQVNVTTYRGVVQLSGFVDSTFAKERAGTLARQVQGVVDVHNDLVLPTGRTY
ncbi:MAG: transport-associated protein [Verrucomicrobiales bacterium]|nr:transport-associated protein [Verrucomicrobiales bacterium]